MAARSRPTVHVATRPTSQPPLDATARQPEAQFNVDLRVSKRFKVGQKATIEGIFEAFNVFNQVNFIEDTNQSSFAISIRSVSQQPGADLRKVHSSI